MKDVKVTESIWNGSEAIVPLAEVSHLINHKMGGCQAIFNHAKWNDETQCMEPNAWIMKEDYDSFINAWCRYRNEVEGNIITPEEMHQEDTTVFYLLQNIEDLNAAIDAYWNGHDRNNENKIRAIESVQKKSFTLVTELRKTYPKVTINF